MRDHFSAATQARDAIVRGRLEHAEAPLTWLGQHAAAKDMPATWRPHVERMQSAARQAKDEGTLAAAAQAIAVTAAQCGACHELVHRGPEFRSAASADTHQPSAAATPRAELRERMHDHAAAIERLWHGLVGPSDAAWREGGERLGRAHGHPPVPPAQRARLERVRALGEQARAVTSDGDRTATYGRILAECGSCHARAGLDPGVLDGLDGKQHAR
jgi:cytochrome c553